MATKLLGLNNKIKFENKEYTVTRISKASVTLTGNKKLVLPLKEVEEILNGSTQ